MEPSFTLVSYRTAVLRYEIIQKKKSFKVFWTSLCSYFMFTQNSFYTTTLMNEFEMGA
jgi:hypothetical protein